MTPQEASMDFRPMPQIYEIIAGKKCVIYADEQPQVMLIQPVGEHENATLDAEIDAIKGAVHVPFVFAGFAISDWEEELTPWHDPFQTGNLVIDGRKKVTLSLLNTKDFHDCESLFGQFLGRFFSSQPLTR